MVGMGTVVAFYVITVCHSSLKIAKQQHTFDSA